MSGSESSDELEEETYEVEKILNQKVIINDNDEEVILYQIKWKDYDENHISWEPIECLTGCEQKMIEFKKDWEQRRISGELDRRPPSRPSSALTNGSARSSHSSSTPNNLNNVVSPAFSAVDVNDNIRKGGTTAAVKSKSVINFDGISSDDDDDGYEPDIKFGENKKPKVSEKPEKKTRTKEKAPKKPSPKLSNQRKKSATASVSSASSNGTSKKSSKKTISLISEDEDEEDDIMVRPSGSTSKAGAASKAGLASSKSGSVSSKSGPSSKAGPPSKAGSSSKAGPASKKRTTETPKEDIPPPKRKIGPRSRLKQLNNGDSDSKSSSSSLSTSSKSSKTSTTAKQVKPSSSPSKREKPSTPPSKPSSSTAVAATVANVPSTSSAISEASPSKTSKRKVGPKSKIKQPPSPTPSTDSSLFLSSVPERPPRPDFKKAPSPPSNVPPFELMELDGQASDGSDSEVENILDVVKDVIMSREELEKHGPTEALVVEDMGHNPTMEGPILVLVKLATVEEKKFIVTRDLVYEEFAPALADYYSRTYTWEV